MTQDRDFIPQQPQRQDSLEDQLRTVHEAAARLGCYEAADWIWKQMYKRPDGLTKEFVEGDVPW